MKKHLLFIGLLLCSLNLTGQHLSICDSLYEIEKNEAKLDYIIDSYENFPVPILKRKYQKSYYQIQIPDSISDADKEYKVFVRFVVDVDSVAKCLEVVYSQEERFNSAAMKKTTEIKYVPATRYSKSIPCIYISIFTFRNNKEQFIINHKK